MKRSSNIITIFCIAFGFLAIIGLEGCGGESGDGESNQIATWYKDLDGDFFSDGFFFEQTEQPNGYYHASDLTSISGDCDDNDDTINPFANEICDDNIDQNCDGIDQSCDPSDIIFLREYMDLEHPGEFYDFEKDEQQIDSELSAVGTYYSEDHVTRYIDNAKAHIQSFVDGSIYEAADVNARSRIGFTAIQEIFGEHRTIDIDYYSVFTEDHISWDETLMEDAKDQILQFIDETYEFAELEMETWF